MPAPLLSRRTPSRARVAAAAIVAVVAAGLAVAPTAQPAARAADTVTVLLPDPTVKAAVNAALGAGREASQEVTAAEAATLTSLTVPDAADRASSLVGLQAFTGLTTLDVTGDRELGDVGPLAGLPLSSLSITGGAVQGTLDSIGKVATLTSLSLVDDRISDLSGLTRLTRLKTLRLADNEVADLAPLQALPQLTDVRLESNRIGNVAPLASLTNPAYLWLSGNRIEDASPLSRYAALLLGTAGSSANPRLLLDGNRVRDLAAFSGFANKPSATGQSVYAGAYQGGGVQVSLARAEGRAIAVYPVNPGQGAYDQGSGTLTLTDPAAPSIEMYPNWTVRFTAPPADPTIAGTASAGQTLTARAGSETRPSCEPAYQWRREGVDIPGATGGAFVLSTADVGSRIGVQVTCGDQVGVSAPTAAVMATSVGAPVVVPSQPKQTGVIGDPTNPGITLRVGQTAADGSRVDPSTLTVTASGGVSTTVSGTGPVRHVSFAPQTRGTDQVTFTVTAPDGRTASGSITYATSVATTPTSRVLIGQGDSSTAIDAGAGYLFVADDERSEIGLYDPEVSGPAVWESETLQDSEVDFESSARQGNTVYWLGSHGNKKDGALTGGRNVVFQTRITGTGVDARLTQTGTPYKGLRSDLVAWDRAHGDRLGLAASTADGVQPDRADGFNLEGAEFSPDGSELYLAFRSPAILVAGSYRAVIVPVTNVDQLFGGTAQHAEFADPILLDLDGHDIREIRKNDAGQYLIVSGTPGMWTPESSQMLFAWTGYPEDPAVPLTTEVTKDVEPFHTENAAAWEGIGALPDDLTDGSQVRLIMDQGYDTLYNSTGENKKTDLLLRKARTDLFTLTGNLGLKAEVTGSGAFSDRAASTISPAQTITLTNTGSERVKVRQVSVRSDTGQADDFLVSTNTCAYTQPGPGASCAIGVRFAPSAAHTTSTARLVVESNLPGVARTVTLSGTSASVPQGLAGPQGPAGPQGAAGPQGPTGTVRISARKSRVVVHRGARARVTFVVDNRTASPIQAVLRAKAPAGLKAVGPRTRTKRVAGLDQGQHRKVWFEWRVGKAAKVGRHQVAVRIRVGDLALRRTVVVRVVR